MEFCKPKWDTWQTRDCSIDGFITPEKSIHPVLNKPKTSTTAMDEGQEYCIELVPAFPLSNSGVRRMDKTQLVYCCSRTIRHDM
jgi:hypothetical protein